MGRWSHIFTGILALGAVTFSSGSASANDCNKCNPCGGFDWGAEFLYWEPCVDDLDVAAILTTDENDNRDIKYKSISLDWEPGVRARIGKSDCFCDLDMTASYTYLRSRTSAKQRFTNLDFDESDPREGIISPLVNPILSLAEIGFGVYDTGDQTWNLYYHEWEILFFTDISCKRCHHFVPYAGVAGIFLDQKLDAE